MVHKIESYSHTESDQSEFKEPSAIVRKVRHGLDIFDREWENNLRVDSLKDIPQHLKGNPGRFEYLLNRDPANANFWDYSH